MLVSSVHTTPCLNATAADKYTLTWLAEPSRARPDVTSHAPADPTWAVGVGLPAVGAAHKVHRHVPTLRCRSGMIPRVAGTLRDFGRRAAAACYAQSQAAVTQT